MTASDAALADLDARWNRQLQARLNDLHAELNHQLLRATDPAERPGVLEWCRAPVHMPPQWPMPVGRVTLDEMAAWYRNELERAMAQAQTLMRAQAERMLAGDALGATVCEVH